MDLSIGHNRNPLVSQFSSFSPQFGIKAHFMNVLTSVTDKQTDIFLMQKFDKRRDLPFKYSQFIKIKSNRPVKQAYNVVISQIVPILYLSNNPIAAMLEIQTLFSTLSANGFQSTKLQQRVIKFLTDNDFPALKFDKDHLLLLLQGMLLIPEFIVFHTGRFDICI